MCISIFSYVRPGLSLPVHRSNTMPCHRIREASASLVVTMSVVTKCRLIYAAAHQFPINQPKYFLNLASTHIAIFYKRTMTL